MTRGMVVYERTDNGFSAYAPDLPCCIAAGYTLEETRELMQAVLISWRWRQQCKTVHELLKTGGC